MQAYRCIIISKSTTKQVTKAYYSGKEYNITSRTPASQEGTKENEKIIDELAARDHSNKISVEKYSVEEICMVAQASRCLRFHIASIRKISKITISVIHLTTKKKTVFLWDLR